MKLYLWIFLLAGFAFGASAQGFDLGDAIDDDDDDVNPKPTPPAKKTPDDEFDLGDALGPDTKTEKPKIVRPKDGGTGGGSFGDDDLLDASQNGYKPDPGKGGKGGGRIADPSGGGGAAQPQENQNPGQVAGIVSALGVALIGAASGYIAYQKKKLCFKMQGGDPERGVNTHRGNQSESNVLSNLLRIS
ncbi:CD99 molecule isoform X2 [Brienomyrus brachyistius]|uniref:CD99 molecule isoform X2 n=1 Tax=Brienomyrus brachyistius TaxID=42636 RepID=UPI0020B31798|nr:CD99 molecule isoform X2 [Brienomyrus brachyistius]